MPRVKWNGTGSRYIEVPGVGPRGLVVLEPGINRVTDAELSAMRPHIQLELTAGLIEIHQTLEPQAPAPGVVDLGETADAQATLPAAASEPAAEPDAQSNPGSILEELLAKTDAELAEIAKEYGVKKRFLEKRENLAKAIMEKAGYKVEVVPEAPSELAASGMPAEPPAAPATTEPAAEQAEPPVMTSPPSDPAPAAPAADPAATEASAETGPDAAPTPVVEPPAASVTEGEPAPERPAT